MRHNAHFNQYRYHHCNTQGLAHKQLAIAFKWCDCCSVCVATNISMGMEKQSETQAVIVCYHVLDYSVLHHSVLFHLVCLVALHAAIALFDGSG